MVQAVKNYVHRTLVANLSPLEARIKRLEARLGVFERKKK